MSTILYFSIVIWMQLLPYTVLIQFNMDVTAFIYCSHVSCACSFDQAGAFYGKLVLIWFLNPNVLQC